MPDNMEYLIRRVHYEELDEAFSLIWNTFLEFVAPDCGKEGIGTFRVNFIENEEFKNCFKNARQIMYGAYLKEKLVGVVSISENNHVSCVFVDKRYHRNGIATMLFNKIISELMKNQIESIRLNASPYAVPFYHIIGFKDLDTQQDFHGILYTPMEFKI
ncbi:GNAT family N-acetyltransferase [Clostridium estertheticum]|uniref:GNAT family N-acetyltransferase n=1 Tax=Clostridium estertheticum TaxID=238834 RepID=UPI001CF45518|nr:GNAT family N-acetyltransferase [Clostridium estertheticum]MCB2359697.1 GNAT family N-acetyltransferase [Clostridium estertheticum]